MSKYSRRDFGKLALGTTGALMLHDLPAFSARPDSRYGGVQIGVQSYSFRDRPLDAALEAIVECGIDVCELWQGHVEPKVERGRPGREQLRKWRTTVALGEIKKIGDRFRRAGVEICAYNYSFRDDFTDAEIDRGFEIARALGAKALTASANVDVSRRVDPFARKHRMLVGMHNHSNLTPNEFARPEDFDVASKGLSRYIAINLDIGHFVAAGFDPVKFIEQNHARIVTLHLKDRKKNQGDNVEFGQGQTPIREVLQLLKSRKYAIPADIEYEYKGKEDSVVEVKKCLAYCKSCLI